MHFEPGGTPANLSEIPHYPFPPDRGLDDHMSRALKADLPGMFPATASTTMPDTREVVGAINNLTEEQRATREEASNRQARSVEKTPATYYGSVTLVLNRLTHTHSSSELPEVYQLIAASTTQHFSSYVLVKELQGAPSHLARRSSSSRPRLLPVHLSVGRSSL